MYVFWRQKFDVLRAVIHGGKFFHDKQASRRAGMGRMCWEAVFGCMQLQW
jgi:hypothetical protein